LHSYFQIRRVCETNRLGHVDSILGDDDQRRMLVDGQVPRSARLVVTRVARRDDASRTCD
jgi:hypothetical protein